MRRRLGSGGFATVWLAHDEQLDAEAAVKHRRARLRPVDQQWYDVRLRCRRGHQVLTENGSAVTERFSVDCGDGGSMLLQRVVDTGTTGSLLVQVLVPPDDRDRALEIASSVSFSG